MNLQNEKKACVLFRSVVEAAEELERDEALELLLTYAHIGLGDEVDLDNCSKVVRLILKQNIESLGAAERRYAAACENGTKGAEAGKKKGGGVGRRRKDETPEEYQKRVEEWRMSKTPSKTPEKPPVITNQKPPENPLEKEKEIEYEKEKEYNNNILKEDNMLVIPKLENDSFYFEDERNVIGHIEEKKVCSQEELVNIYKNNFGELLSNYPNLNYNLIKTNNFDSFYECYSDVVNEYLLRVRQNSQRNISKEEFLKTFLNYLNFIEYSYQ